MFARVLVALMFLNCLLPGGLGSVALAHPETELPEQLAEVGVTERLSESLPLGTVFTNDGGQSVTLGSLFSGKRPIILSMNYSNCPMLCNLQLSGLVDCLKELDWSAGTEYDVVSISIDPLETPGRARETKERYVGEYDRPKTANGWHFLVGNSKSIAAVTEATGFRYKYVRERKEYAHTAVFMLCTPDGKLSRYLYGVKFDPQTVKLSLFEAGEGKIGSAMEQLFLYCFHYDPSTGRYGLAAVRAMQFGGAITVLLIGSALTFAYRRERSAAKQVTQADSQSTTTPADILPKTMSAV
jgi:protein SCO1